MKTLQVKKIFRPKIYKTIMILIQDQAVLEFDRYI